MASYTSQERLEAYLGESVLAEIRTTPGINLATIISDMSDLVASYLRNSGYAPPDTNDPATIMDRTVCLAADAAVIRALGEVRDVALPLPENWRGSAQFVALEGIVDGTATLNLPRSTASSVGGFLATNSSSNVADAGRPQRASRRELAGW